MDSTSGQNTYLWDITRSYDGQFICVDDAPLSVILVTRVVGAKVSPCGGRRAKEEGLPRVLGVCSVQIEWRFLGNSKETR